MIILKVKKLQTHTLLTLFVLMLIVLPMSIFAQAKIENTVLNTTDASIEQTEIPEETDAIEVAKYYDNYTREELPPSNKGFNDFVVGPGSYGVEIAPGESKTVLLNVSNRLGKKRLFRLVTEDMTSNNEEEGSVIRFLGDEVGPYTLKDYISVPYTTFYIEEGERVIIPVTITIPTDAEPRGFYGSILTEVLPDTSTDIDTDVAPTTALISRIGTLFFVTTPGNIEREGSLIDFTTLLDKKLYFNGPISMGLVYENTGSVHLKPEGEMRITNILGETVGQVEITPWFVMPESIRTREVSWNREFLFGRYQVMVNIDRGYDDIVDTKTLVFWVLPWKLILTVFAGVFLFFLLVRFLARNFEFKRK